MRTAAAVLSAAGSTPEWGALWAFPIGLVVLFAAAAVFFLRWRTGDASPSQPLEYLESTWSFSDSWVSNVTVAGGVLTGILGSSDIVTASLGEDAKSSVALATIGAAVAVAFIGAGPIVLLATKSTEGDFVTVGGLLAASAVTLTGAYGEIWVLYRAARRLELGGWEGRVVVLAVLAAALLTFYSYRTLLATLRHGTTPHRLPPSDAIRAASMIVAALKAHGDIDAGELDRAIARTTEAVAAEPPDGPMGPRRSSRSALL